MTIKDNKGKRDLKDGVDKRKRGLDKREGYMRKVVKEKKEISDVSRKLRYPLKDSIPDIKKSLSESSKAVEKEFMKQNEDLEKQHKDCVKAEEDFKGRTKMAQDNAKKAKKAKTNITESHKAKPILDRARIISLEDAKFTDTHRDRQQRDRKRSIDNRNQLRSKLQSIQLKL